MIASKPTHTFDIVLVRKDVAGSSVKTGFWTVVALSVLAMFALTYFVMTGTENPGVLAKMWEIWVENPENLLKTLGGLLVIVTHLYLFYVISNDRIVISAAGIAYETPLPRWLPATFTDWKWFWTRIKHTTITLPLGFGQPYLTLRDGQQSRKILIDAWVVAADRAKTPSFREIFRLQSVARRGNVDDIRVRLEQSPLILALRAHNIPVQYPETTVAGLMFDLRSQPRTQIAVAVLIGLLSYAAVDTFFLDETYVENFQWTTWIVSGIITALLAQRWISSPSIPRIVSIGLAVMLGLGVAVALYPGLLRLNQLTDSDGLQPHEYILQEYAELVPVEEGLPTVRFNYYRDYWRQFPLGSSHRLYLRRGGLEFYQLDQAPLAEAMRSYYEKQGTAKSTSKRR